MMHQTPRSAPRPFSPASSPQTNPARTNNPRDPTSPAPSSPRPTSEAESASDHAAGMSRPSSERPFGGPTKDSVKKLDQIIQNVYSKAGTIILQERMRVTPTLVGRTLEKKTSRWFQLDTDDIDDFKDEFRTWKQCGGLDNRPPPLIIETYLDTSRLKSGQSLVILDDNGKRWDVVEALTASDASSDSSSGWPSKPNPHVILERWKVELKGTIPDDLDDFGAQLPTIYKKAIVLCRSIFTTTGILPAWKLARKSKTQGIHPASQVRCRIRASDSLGSGLDALRSPLFDGPADVATDYMFGQLEVPVGRFYVSVSYRNNCNFQVVETESLLSSRIGIAISDDMFKPSLPHRTQTEYAKANRRALEVGSLPYSRQTGNITDNQQRYGSLSTFHGEGPLGTSPISALRAVKAPESDTSSPPGSRPESIEPPPHSLPITGPARRPSVRTGTSDSHGRRPSVSFQSSPFKHGSLSGSPGRRLHGDEAPFSPSSLSRLSGPNTLTHTRNRSSLTAGMPASLRGGPPQPATDSFVAGSPRPSVTNRFSSSFSHRRSRTSFGGTSRVGDDDQNSSGKQSLASSLAQPGSGLLNEAGGGGSSGSFQTDDDNIQEFLKVLDSKKTLQSFEPSKKGESATSRTRAQLNKFQLMRESNNALTDSLNSSTQLQAPSSTSSRHIANIPGMSTSSSPGKPLSPHTPHTPAVPSRLSENSSIDHEPTVRETTITAVGRAPTSAAGTTAIDIPISPRPYTHVRRSSSAAQKHRVLADDEDQRSISLGADDREPPSLSALLGRNMASGVDDGDASPVLQPPADITTTESPSVPGSGSASEERETRPPGGLYAGYSSSPYGRRYGSSAGRGATPPHSGSGSLAGSSTGRYGRGYTRARPTSGLGPLGGGPAGDEPEEEPLLFDMSEINRDQSRRSIEEGRGGGNTGSGSVGDRGGPGGYEAAHRQRRWQ
ncbi:autophagy-related protein 13-domain-containing protein [Microdochium trichocladiopsis]|uniref:Autophagy-related protein 13 n=1 Tax=Microdochium trichocladiopsis TaxID=1682393 RepID=A0A9P8XYM6_9PEZI|nr:autophagy-related protein 13-domain-containing protein [Microdochium trichocladiopsis]KAH7020948.1 autophagy-related protein 13-domain-containing protein [Microdochium trichocladiopsis]